MDTSLVALSLFAFNIWTAVMTLQTARRRGRSERAWMWLGILFGPFAWLAVALLPPIRREATG